jgi:hypothetical protein
LPGSDLGFVAATDLAKKRWYLGLARSRLDGVSRRGDLGFCLLDGVDWFSDLLEEAFSSGALSKSSLLSDDGISIGRGMDADFLKGIVESTMARRGDKLWFLTGSDEERLNSRDRTNPVTDSLLEIPSLSLLVPEPKLLPCTDASFSEDIADLSAVDAELDSAEKFVDLELD